MMSSGDTYILTGLVEMVGGALALIAFAVCLVAKRLRSRRLQGRSRSVLS